MRITAVVWGSELPLLREAANREGVTLNAWVTFRLRNAKNLGSCISTLHDADIIILHPTQEGYWDTLVSGLPEGVPVISFGTDPSFWAVSNQPPAVVARVSAYSRTAGSPT